MPDAVGHHAGRVHKGAPCAASGSRSPGKWRVLVREPGVHAERIFHLGMDKLSTLVEWPEFFSETVDGFARGKGKSRSPQSPSLHAPERRQAGPAPEMLIGDRREQWRA